ncbi:carotenoid oxygenase family protein [Plectonema cf. radiosum LEGE 06105]|uniref:Carotenoid oxygenase family protein n=1 Tax=Plectonema cf. radiosum LEGE 06105 TaxID=945769 RepID=A0A8J7K0C1_9CYAN|nr:carotenoid oxygenase family protein [Plectonema radiosum]MBE9211182.1 carotenoid oxygenase family protein [Plectonema cf. radiosum LEGE 06105]
MQTIDKSAKKAWAKALEKPATEFPLTPLSIIDGEIPASLNGTLYRNGPGRLERGGISVGHWFDGDGAILAVHLRENNASAVYRYVQTEEFKQEASAGKLLYGNYGMTAPGAIWNQWLKPIKNAANTSVLALPDKLLALWEGDNPHALDLENLDTFGKDDLGGLDNGLAYSAHPKVDSQTGEIFNFGISPGLNATLNIYKSDATGRILKKVAHQIDGVPLVHDFVLAGGYLIFFIPPVRLNLLMPAIGLSCYSDALEWQPSKGTQILIIDRDTLNIISRGETESWFQWHFSNGYVDNSGAVIVDIASYQDFQTNQYLKEVATGETHTAAKSSLTRVTLNPQTGKLNNIERLFDRHCEFPIVPQQNVGKYSRYTYLSTVKEGTYISQEILNSIACFNHQTDTLIEANFGDNLYPSEPIYAQGWILTVVYDGNSDSSEVWIFDADYLDKPPVCKLSLPSVIPPGFHGSWKDG